MRNYFKKLVYLVVITWFSNSYGGSFDDFFRAIKQDNGNVITQLINRGFDANTLSPAGEHALFLAIREPSPKVVAALMGWPGIVVESRNRADESPLMMAAIMGNLTLCKQLVDKGADVNKPGWAPLHYASTKGHVEVMRFLLDEHAYIDASSPNGSTPLMMAALYGSPLAVKLLLEAGADPMIKNDLGLTAIDFAQRGNRADSAEIVAAFVRGRHPKGTW